jgi:DNA-binding NtrC family response regulator
MILVADDDKVLTQLFRNLLEDAGYRVEVVHDGEHAYDHLKDPDCKGMILDIRMPGLNGAELLMIMAAEEIDVPVIVVAGFPDFDEDEMKEFPNVKRFFLKPLYPEEVLAAVKEIAPKE